MAGRPSPGWQIPAHASGSIDPSSVVTWVSAKTTCMPAGCGVWARLDSHSDTQLGATWNISQRVKPGASGIWSVSFTQNTGRQVWFASDQRLPLVEEWLASPLLPQVPYRSARITTFESPSGNDLARLELPSDRSTAVPPSGLPKTL